MPALRQSAFAKSPADKSEIRNLKELEQNVHAAYEPFQAKSIR